MVSSRTCAAGEAIDRIRGDAAEKEDDQCLHLTVTAANCPNATPYKKVSM